MHMKVKKLWTQSSNPLIDIDKNMDGYVEQILKEDIPASVIFAEERQEDPVWGRKKRYGWFGLEEMIQVGSVPKKRINLTIEYVKPRDLENALKDFQRISQISPLVNYWNPQVILDGMKFLTGKWHLSSQSDRSKKITDPLSSDSMTANVTFWGIVDSDEMRQALVSLTDQLHEPVRVSRHYYTTTHDGGSCRGYPPQLKLVKSWEGFDEDMLSDFFQKVQKLVKSYHLMEKWLDPPHHIIFPDDEHFEMFYKLDLLEKTYQAEKKPVQVGYTVLDYPSLEVTVKLWRNSTCELEDEARCFFVLKHEAKMTAYRP